MWKYHILHIETKLEFQAEDKKENINLLTFLCESCQDVNYQLLLAESVNHRTIQLLMGVTGRQDQFVEILFVVRQNIKIIFMF